MDLQESQKCIESSEDFKSFKEVNKGSFLVMIIFVKRDNQDSLQYCYYMPERKKVAVFDAESCSLLHEDEMLSADAGFKPLDLSKVNVDIPTALTKSEEGFNKEFKNKPISQKICMLSDGEWSVTLMTPALDVFNTRVDASSGEVKNTNSANARDFIKEG